MLVEIDFRAPGRDIIMTREQRQASRNAVFRPVVALRAKGERSVIWNVDDVLECAIYSIPFGKKMHRITQRLGHMRERALIRISRMRNVFIAEIKRWENDRAAGVFFLDI